MIPPLVARILLGLLLAGVAAIFAWKHCCALWKYWSAPWRSDHHRLLSLVRILLGLILFSICLPFWDGQRWQAAVITREYFWKYNGALVVIVLSVAMLGDIITSKGGLAVLMGLTANKLATLPNLAVSVPGMTAGAAPAPNPTPVPDPIPGPPDLKPADQSG